MYTLNEKKNHCLDIFIQTDLIQDAATYIVIYQKNVFNVYCIIKNHKTIVIDRFISNIKINRRKITYIY